LAAAGERPRPFLRDDDRGDAATRPVDQGARTVVAPSVSPWQRLFPNWRVLFGAALATLVISAVVLGMRYNETVTSSARSLDTLLVSEGAQGSQTSRRMAI